MSSKLEPVIWLRDTGHIGIHGAADVRTVDDVMAIKPNFLTSMGYHIFLAMVLLFESSAIKQKYNNKAKLFFTDTDSLTYEIETNDVYQDFWRNKDKFDNSDYPENSPFYDKTNKKVIGRFKDECQSITVADFVGLR